jgi:hypothetical protein
MTTNIETVNTRIGELAFENGYPSKDSVNKLFDELDFQRRAVLSLGFTHRSICRVAEDAHGGLWGQANRHDYLPKPL